MKKQILKALSCTLAACFVLSSAVFTASAVSLAGSTVTASRTLAEGVTWTKFSTSGSTYGTQHFNIVEADLANTGLYLDRVQASSQYATSYKKTSEMASSFKTGEGATEGKTPIAAINADLYMMQSAHARVENAPGSGMSNTTFAGCNDAVVKAGTASTALPRGFTMTNGEIISTAQMSQETPLQNEFWAFGVTNDNVPVISNPAATVTIRNNTRNTEASADGINRLPANNALVMYTDKGCENNRALDDALEVAIDFTSDYKINHGASITGTVAQVCGPTDSANPQMKANRIILTSRGTRKNLLSEYKVGDSITINVSVFDKTGKYTEQWQKVTEAVSGHYNFAVDGKSSNIGIESGYPSTIIAITKDNKVLMITADGRGAGGATGIAGSAYGQLGTELNIKDALLLDGGGSTTMVVLDSDEYKVQNTPSDTNAQERSVISSLVLSTGPSRGSQGTVPAIPDTALDMTNIDFSNNVVLGSLTNPNDCTVDTIVDGALKVSTISGNDPHFNINFANSKTAISANTYKYVNITYKVPTTNSTASKSSNFQMFMIVGGITGPAEVSSVTKPLISDGEYHTMTLDMSSYSWWNGTLNQMRCDYFASAAANDVFYIDSIQLFKTKTEAENGTADNEKPDDTAEKLDITPATLESINSTGTYNGVGFWEKGTGAADDRLLPFSNEWAAAGYTKGTTDSLIVIMNGGNYIKIADNVDLSKYSAVTITYGAGGEVTEQGSSIGLFSAATAFEQADTKNDASYIASSSTLATPSNWISTVKTTINLNSSYKGPLYLSFFIADGNGICITDISFTLKQAVVPTAEIQVFGDNMINIPEGLTISELEAKFDEAEIKAEVVAASGNTKVGTGTQIKLLDNEGNVVKTVEAVISGDINGDGVISVKDITLIKRYNCGKATLGNSAILAGRVSKDITTDITTKDITLLSRYNSGKAKNLNVGATAPIAK